MMMSCTRRILTKSSRYMAGLSPSCCLICSAFRQEAVAPVLARMDTTCLRSTKSCRFALDRPLCRYFEIFAFVFFFLFHMKPRVRDCVIKVASSTFWPFSSNFYFLELGTHSCIFFISLKQYIMNCKIRYFIKFVSIIIIFTASISTNYRFYISCYRDITG